VLTTATFVGYLLARVPGAIVATVAIFLPSFAFVALSSPLIPRLRRSPWAGGFLDGANAASVALMVLVTWLAGTRGHRGLGDGRARAGGRPQSC
jgi:chromate transporter